LYAARARVRLDLPYRSPTSRERDIVLHGEPVRRRVRLRSGRNGRTVQLSVNYDNAVAAVERSLRSDNERTRRQVQRFLVTRVCSVCHGTRLRPEALTSQLGGRNLAEISALGLGELRGFMAGLSAGLPAELSRMTTGLLAELNGTLTPLLEVGLSYLTLDRPGASLSTGERQRIELTSTVRASTTGMLYVLDEPSVGLHPSNVQGLLKTITALAGNGNSVVVVEHERELIRSTDWIIELGPAAGQPAVRRGAIRERRGVVDGGTHQRVAELHARLVDLDQALLLGRHQRFGSSSKLPPAAAPRSGASATAASSRAARVGSGRASSRSMMMAESRSVSGSGSASQRRPATGSAAIARASSISAIGFPAACTSTWPRARPRGGQGCRSSSLPGAVAFRCSRRTESPLVSGSDRQGQLVERDRHAPAWWLLGR
jgi:hypothetical protein